MKLHHLITSIFIISLFYFFIGSFVAHFLDRIFYKISHGIKNEYDNKNIKILKIIILGILQTFFIILSVHFIRKGFKYTYNDFFKSSFGDFDLPEVDGIILLGSLYTIFSTHYKENLEELIHLVYNE